MSLTKATNNFINIQIKANDLENKYKIVKDELEKARN